MNIQDKTNMLIKKYTEIQRKLYHQIEKVEHSIILLNERKNGLGGVFNKNKINAILNKLEKYKMKLNGHANFVDIKLSVLNKEIAKAEATEESINKIDSYSYYNENIIEMPEDLREALAKFGIKFDSTKINLTSDSFANSEQEEMSM